MKSQAPVNGCSSKKSRSRASVTQVNNYPISKEISRLQGRKSLIDLSTCW